jgi:hypothetical protein
VHWLRPQLQQLLLPGDVRKAAAALQELQEQQHHLRQALETALWRLKKAAVLIANCQIGRELQQWQQQHGSTNSIGYGHCFGRSIICEGECTADVNLVELASSRPEASPRLADLDSTQMPIDGSLKAETAAALVGTELPQQLQQFGSALWSALPQPRCCNNAACANLGSISEAKLVAGRTSRCSKCKAAK